ncbi:MAG: redox-active disulfide protein 2 [uncultured bacterium]|nr:MAG: redox-active disulfide protein 2 [uncultured bacterium]
MSNQITSIQVLGSGCPTCKKLFELTKQAVIEFDLKIEVEYLTDIQKIMEMGVMSSPVLAINGQAVLAGQLPSREKIKELLTLNNQPKIEESISSYSCGGNC